jgi:uncharacterized protein (DUF983 family)
MESEHSQRGYLTTVFSCRCPRCREGKLFKHSLSLLLKRNMEMNDECPVCKQPTDIEVGFYYGTSYISYLICIVIVIISFFIWYLTIGFSFQDNRFLFWIIFICILLAFLQPWLMRFSRVLWLSFFVKYDPDWAHHKPENPERIIKEQMNNW